MSSKAKGSHKGEDAAPLRNLIRMMMAMDALRGSLRWATAMQEPKTSTAKSDYLLSLITCCGWAWEVVQLIRKGKRDGWLDSSMLAGVPPVKIVEIECAWSEICADTDSERLRRVRQIRNKCFGHFDKDAPDKFIKRRFDVDAIPPICDADDNDDFLDWRFLWAYGAFAVWFSEESFDEREAERRLNEIEDFIRAVAAMLNVLIAQLYHKLNLSGIPMYDSLSTTDCDGCAEAIVDLVYGAQHEERPGEF